ncbi:hypothetical protein SUGI_0481430 [Cryptomeria japonica]|uniref:peroxidase 10 n=1 Tax=Cryptomeria japonica TaxID=3369 RepID=UPI002408D5E9|nr:peroxidase 10 [Cryptomeria japonica]GLJ25168.1 hypothetical protein SUGI_0481430 [Cryptomeria japonica]
MEKVYVLCLFSAFFLSLACAGSENDLYSNADLTLENGVSWTFYKSTCPKLESIVQKQIKLYLKKDIAQAGGLVCDASIVLDGSASGPAKQDVPPNLMMRGKAFAHVDKACHVVVSCARMPPITGLAARDSVPRVCGMITATQNPECGKNANKWPQFAKVESFTVMCKDLTDKQGEKLLATQCKNRQQTSVSTMDREFKGRTLLEPPEPKPDPGHAANHH